MKRLLFLIYLSLTLQLSTQIYPRLIIKGDSPDPSIMCDREDFYMTHSPFYYAPGFLIYDEETFAGVKKDRMKNI